MYKLEELHSGICSAKGFYADGVSAGLKGEGALDLAFIYSPKVCELAAVFTSNRFCAAPLKHAKGTTQSNFILINSKNANAMTGEAGVEDVKEILGALPFDVTNPLMSSTGVIGVRLPKEKIIKAASAFDITRQEPHRAAQAIMTTDAFSKEAAFRVTLSDGSSFSIGAMAKGAGMINPAMATMLCFIATDAKVEQKKLQAILDRVNAKTFNSVSVDGDTSTNDTVFLMANADSGAFHEEAFEEALYKIMLTLAKMLVRDGEGATKLITYEITGAKDDSEAETVAKMLSNSLLVKTAFYGEDPNWGRIAMSIGASGVTCSEESLSICYDDVYVYKEGVNLFDDAIEAEASKVLGQDSFSVKCDLGVGEGRFVAYGCDLGYEYVKINADYRT